MMIYAYVILAIFSIVGLVAWGVVMFFAMRPTLALGHVTHTTTDVKLLISRERFRQIVDAPSRTDAREIASIALRELGE